MIERERRFLVAEVPDDLPPPSRIVQAYVYTDPVALRVRRIDDSRHVLTIKAGSGRERTEIEHEIDPDDFATLWDAAGELRLEKRRHRITLPGGLTAELDLYDGQLAGHLLVEVEFPDAGSADAFEPPDWFGREVTEDGRYTNTSLARSGWPKED